MPDTRGRQFNLALVFSGGNALGAYQGGAYQALHEHGFEPDWVIGASAGAINGAVICGNPQDRRLALLQELWRPAATVSPSFSTLDEARRSASAIWTMVAGRQGLFAPRHLFGPWWNPFGNPEPSSLYDSTPMLRTLERLIDFELLNRNRLRYCATAVDIQSGEDIIFDSARLRIEPDHIRASAALAPAFPPVEIGGRWLADAGLSANLPVDNVLGETHDRPLLCIAVDLLPLRAPRPHTLGETIIRAQDLMFATQSRRTIAAWQTLYDERTRNGASTSVALLHIAYSNHSREVSGKAFDFSAESIATRWREGSADMAIALDDLAAGRIPVGEPGMAVYSMSADQRRLEQVHWRLEARHG